MIPTPRGIARDGKALIMYFNREMTDDDMKEVFDLLKSAIARPPSPQDVEKKTDELPYWGR